MSTPKTLMRLFLFGEKGSAVIGGLAVNRIEPAFSDAEERGDTEEKVLEPDRKDPPRLRFRTFNLI